MTSQNTDQTSIDERWETIINFGWVFTIAFAFVISQAFPDLAEEAALVMTLTPMLILLISLAPDKNTKASKDTQ